MRVSEGVKMAGNATAFSSHFLCARRMVDETHRMMIVNVFPETIRKVISVLVFFSCLLEIPLSLSLFSSLLILLLRWTSQCGFMWCLTSKHTFPPGNGLGHTVQGGQDLAGDRLFQNNSEFPRGAFLQELSCSLEHISSSQT